MDRGQPRWHALGPSSKEDIACLTAYTTSLVSEAMQTVLKAILLSLLVLGSPSCFMDTGGTGDELTNAEVEGTVSALRSIGEYCVSTCQCELGSECKSNQCTEILDFSPPPPSPPCAWSCQCPYPNSCVFSGGSAYGLCESPTVPCSSDCDCGVSSTCVSGQCLVDFGPYPHCRCDKHCPSGKQCINGGCQ